jgi:hypothetical protein
MYNVHPVRHRAFRAWKLLFLAALFISFWNCQETSGLDFLQGLRVSKRAGSVLEGLLLKDAG